MRNKLWLFLFILSAPSCVTVPNTTECTTAGLLSKGAICAESLTGVTSDLTFDQWIEFLEPKEATQDQPARGGAICESAADWSARNTALEQACRELGSKCSADVKKVISADALRRILIR